MLIKILADSSRKIRISIPISIGDLSLYSRDSIYASVNDTVFVIHQSATIVWRNGISSRKSDRFFAEDGILSSPKKYAIKPLGGVFVAQCVTPLAILYTKSPEVGRRVYTPAK